MPDVPSTIDELNLWCKVTETEKNGSVRQNTRFSIARNKNLYAIVTSGGDITVESIKNNPDVDSCVHPFAEALIKYFNRKDDELGKSVDGLKAEMDDKKRLLGYTGCCARAIQKFGCCLRQIQKNVL